MPRLLVTTVFVLVCVCACLHTRIRVLVHTRIRVHLVHWGGLLVGGARAARHLGLARAVKDRLCRELVGVKVWRQQLPARQRTVSGRRR